MKIVDPAGGAGLSHAQDRAGEPNDAQVQQLAVAGIIDDGKPRGKGGHVTTTPVVHGAAAPNGPITRVVPGPDGIVHLPADTSLQNIHTQGHDLVIQLPDGSQIIVVDGAIYTPHIVLGDVD